ncbi:MAG: glycosyltransferase family 9 protein [Methylacidiphilales bacterium]|nr:glycosyltransferase family 9 protein [Candidatus Methylacidiphilales bacterium]
MKILIIRLSAIGDLVFTSTILPYLTVHYPNVHITWLVKKQFATMVSGFEGVNKVISFDSNNLFSSITLIRNEQYDLALDLQGLLKTSLLLLITRAYRKIGLGSSEGGQWLIREVITKKSQCYNKDSDLFGHEYRNLGWYLTGQEKRQDQVNYTFSKEIINKRKEFIEKLPHREYIVICPFTTRMQKTWPWENWKRLVLLLASRTEYTIVVLGSEFDKFPIPHELKDSSKLIVACGFGSIEWSFAVIQGAKAVVSVDTGLGHFASLMNKPTVLLFGSTRPYLKTSNDSSRILFKNLPCSPCHRRPICDGVYHCMRMNSPQEVVENLISLKIIK